uniref:Peptidase M13 C-terminal domain-containing protein n=1 Tax=Clastoptera arizonana TaxID=38151 RepID=A0A1B6DC90_9HEMI
MKKLLQMFLPATMSSDAAKKESDSIINFSLMLSKIYPRAKDIAYRLQQDGAYMTSDLSKLQQVYDFVNWKSLFEDIFETNVTINDPIYVMAPTYMSRLRHVISHFQPRIVHNALLLVYATDVLHEIVNTTLNEKERPRFCMGVTVKALSQAVSALYVTQYSKEYLKHLSYQIENMFSVLKRTLESRIKGTTWMDESTKAYALGKLATLKGQFNTWPQLWNDSFVNQLISELDVGNNFFKNVISRYRQLRSIPGDFHKITPPEKKWAYPFMVNAFYEVTMNSVVMPFAVLNQPYFLNEVPKFIAFGTMGLIFSHEILHAFDLTGVEYNENGTKHSWMTTESKLRLEARLECIAKQYASTFIHQVEFLGDQVNVEFDWNITRNENMADVSGLQVAYDAWQSLLQTSRDQKLPGLHLSTSQLFFLYAGQVYCSDVSPEDYIVSVEKDFHTPAPQRVNGVMMNSQAFSAAFNCPVGSKMNPKKKCTVF